MRVSMIAAVLFCVTIASASAQPHPEATPRDQIDGVVAAPPPAATRLYQNACIGTEDISAPQSFFPPSIGPYFHSFYFTTPGDSDTYRIDVATTGLRVNSATQVAAISGSPESDTRFNTLIETLRAAAASRSKFRIDARNSRVTQVIVAWSQRCGG